MYQSDNQSNNHLLCSLTNSRGLLKLNPSSLFPLFPSLPLPLSRHFPFPLLMALLINYHILQPLSYTHHLLLPFSSPRHLIPPLLCISPPSPTLLLCAYSLIAQYYRPYAPI